MCFTVSVGWAGPGGLALLPPLSATRAPPAARTTTTATPASTSERFLGGATGATDLAEIRVVGAARARLAMRWGLPLRSGRGRRAPQGPAAWAEPGWVGGARPDVSVSWVWPWASARVRGIAVVAEPPTPKAR